ncbi:tRNA-dihydrouridine synthase family protein [Candidatus Saccharibacteria bacterium]|nr:tRNA-dihydrouridine synthase family protein [Candidatus Saccharibacteria bacterium]
MNIWEKLPRPFTALAPMEGVTDVVFREVIARAGRPDLFYTEFTNVSSYASEKGRHNALERLTVAPTDAPIIAQIWGKEPEHFATTAGALAELGFAGVDINMGCPDKNVNKTGGGAAMIKTPELAIECIRNAKGATELPVSVKTRLGWSAVEEYQEWLPRLLNEKLAALTVHLRTKKEMSKVPAHYELIPEIVRMRDEITPDTVLVVNGDIKDLAQVREMYAQYPGVEGFMIGRGVFQNPYCFTDYMATREDLMKLLKLHLELYKKYLDNSLETVSREGCYPSDASEPREDGRKRVGSRGIRPSIPCEPSNDRCERGGDEKAHPNVPYEPLKHFFKIYVNNFPGAAELRAKLMETHSVEEARAILAEAGEL